METQHHDVEGFIMAGGLTVCPPPARRNPISANIANGRRSPRQDAMHRPNLDFPEAALGKALLLILLQDLAGKGCDGGDYECRLKHKNDAMRWFFRKSCANDFEAWCAIAGYEPTFIRGVAKSVLENGLPKLRELPGDGKLYAYGKEWRSKNRKKRKARK